MKKIVTSLLLLLAMPIPVISNAASKTVTIEWTMYDISNVQGYRMYNSYYSNMTGKAFVCQSDNPAATTMTCSVDIASYPVYFTIAALMSDGTEFSSSSEEVTTRVRLSAPKGFRVLF